MTGAAAAVLAVLTVLAIVLVSNTSDRKPSGGERTTTEISPVQECRVGPGPAGRMAEVSEFGSTTAVCLQELPDGSGTYQ